MQTPEFNQDSLSQSSSESSKIVNEREQLLRAEQEARLRTEQLQTLTAALSAARTSQEIAIATLQVGKRVIGANRGLVCRVVADESCERALTVVGAIGYDVTTLEKWRPSLDASPASEVMRTAKPIVITHRSELIARYPALSELWESENVSGTATFPLLGLSMERSAAAQTVCGFVTFDFDNECELTSSEVQFLYALTRLCAQALDRAYLYGADRATRRKLESVLGAISDAFFMFDHNWRFTYLNPRAEQLAGRPREQLLGRLVWEEFPDGINSEFERGLRGAMKSGAPVSFEAFYAPLAVWVGVHAYPTPEGLAVYSQDITARHDAVERLRASEAQLQAIFEAAPVGLLLATAPEGSVVKANRQAADMLDLPELLSGEACALREHAAFHEDRRRVLIDEYPLVRALRGESHAELECLYRRGDGRYAWLRSIGEPMYDTAGQITGALVATVDIDSERRASQALKELTDELRETQLRLEVALDGGRMGVWHWSPFTDEAHWNRQMFDLHGLPPSEDGRVQGTMILSKVHPDDRPAVDSAIARSISERAPYETEARLIRDDGEVRWMLYRAKVICDSDGAVVSMVGVTVDITAQKMAQQALLEADCRRNEFLAMLGHELRNPLAPIANAARLLEKSDLRPEQRCAAVQIINRQSEQLARLVDDLLEVSRVTQGRIELQKENILAITAILSAAETVRPLMREQGQELEIDVPTDVHLIADPVRLTQIIANLLSNAAKYTHPGGHVSVRARAVDDAWFEIAVADNGAGIEPELLPRVFDLFSQGVATIDRARGGLGIGLALARRLVEMHDGTICAESPGPGNGATFTIRLPLPPPHASRFGGRHHSSKAMRPRSILVVDDNADAAQSLATLLELDGHRVHIAYDGVSALDQARSVRPEVILLDIGLPKLDGYAVANTLRRDPNLAKTIIIAVSGYGQRLDRDKSRLAGFDAHLLKPADLDEIYRAMEQ